MLRIRLGGASEVDLGQRSEEEARRDESKTLEVEGDFGS